MHDPSRAFRRTASKSRYLPGFDRASTDHAVRRSHRRTRSGAVREVLDVIVELADSVQTMLIVTHEMAFARAVVDKVILLEHDGIVQKSNEVEAFFTNPQSSRAKRFLSTFTYNRERQN